MKLTFREALRQDIPALKRIRDNVSENRLLSGQIGAEAYEKALFQDGKGWVATDPQTRAERLYRRRNWIESGVLPNGEIEFRLKKRTKDTV